MIDDLHFDLAAMGVPGEAEFDPKLGGTVEAVRIM